MLKRRIFIGLIGISLILLSCIIIPKVVNASGENWLTGWDYRKSHIINDASGAGINYQIMVVVDFGSGMDSGVIVYLDGSCQTDFDDVRFTDNDGDTELDYWMGLKVDSNYAVFLVEIADDLSSSPVIVYVYYGNNAVSTTSNGSNTFLYFDHFDDDSIDGDWNIQGSPIESGTEILLNDDDALYSSTTFGVGGVAVMVRVKTDEQDIEFVAFKSDFGVGGRTEDYANILNSDINFPDDFDRLRCDSNDGGNPPTTETSVDNQLDFQNNYYVYEIAWKDDTQIKFYQDGNLLATHTIGDIPNLAIGVGWRVWDSSQESTLTVDWIAVRKYVDPEPIHGVWGEEESSVVIFITWQFNEGGKLYMNYTELTNSSEIEYVNSTLFMLLGSTINSSYTWLNFTWTENNSIINPYNLTLYGNNTVWCYFGEGNGGIDESYFVLGFVITGCSMLFIIIVIKGDKKKKEK